jgi:hypothetical protein
VKKRQEDMARLNPQPQPGLNGQSEAVN